MHVILSTHTQNIEIIGNVVNIVLSIGFDARIILILQVRSEVRKLHRETPEKNDVQQARRVGACGSQRHGQQ